MIGTQIGQYRVVAKIGEGGMGAVFEAVDEQIGKHVAIKVLHKEHAKNPQIALRFVNEAKAITHVDHPGLVQIITHGQLADGTAYIAMELLKGETLNQRMKAGGGRMSLLTAMAFARQLASALAAAHAKGIIHRDLKPDNVMLVPDQVVPGGERTKLLDFGIAKLKAEIQGSGDQVMTRAGVMMGTPLYMSPEQCRNASDVDDKADVYSLGVMLYRMLAGKPPFSAPGTGELMAMHIYMQPPPLAEADRSLPEPLCQLVHKMLAKKREERPSMSQVAQDLERIGVKASGMMPIVTGPSSGQAQAMASSRSVQPVQPINDGATVLSDPNKPLSIPTPPQTGGTQSGGRAGVIVGTTMALLLLAGGGVAVYRFVLRPQTQVVVPKVENKTPDKPTEPESPKQQAVNWHIESEPPGAMITDVDTKEQLGSTPFRNNQPAKPGMVTIELKLKGYQAVKLTLDGLKDSEPPMVKLEPEKGKRPKKKDKKEKDGEKAAK